MPGGRHAEHVTFAPATIMMVIRASVRLWEILYSTPGLALFTLCVPGGAHRHRATVWPVSRLPSAANAEPMRRTSRKSCISGGVTIKNVLFWVHTRSQDVFAESPDGLKLGTKLYAAHSTHAHETIIIILIKTMMILSEVKYYFTITTTVRRGWAAKKRNAR